MCEDNGFLDYVNENHSKHEKMWIEIREKRKMYQQIDCCTPEDQELFYAILSIIKNMDPIYRRINSSGRLERSEAIDILCVVRLYPKITTDELADMIEAIFVSRLRSILPVGSSLQSIAQQIHEMTSIKD